MIGWGGADDGGGLGWIRWGGADNKGGGAIDGVGVE